MPWSQTPAASCLLALCALRVARPLSHSGLLPSAKCTASAFSRCFGIILLTATIHISGLNTQPAPSLRSASDFPYGIYPRTSLLICRLHFNQVELASTGQHHRISMNNAVSQRSGFSLARAFWCYVVSQRTIIIFFVSKYAGLGFLESDTSLKV